MTFKDPFQLKTLYDSMILTTILPFQGAAVQSRLYCEFCVSVHAKMPNNGESSKKAYSLC